MTSAASSQDGTSCSPSLHPEKWLFGTSGSHLLERSSCTHEVHLSRLVERITTYNLDILPGLGKQDL